MVEVVVNAITSCVQPEEGIKRRREPRNSRGSSLASFILLLLLLTQPASPRDRRFTRASPEYLLACGVFLKPYLTCVYAALVMHPIVTRLFLLLYLVL